MENSVQNQNLLERFNNWMKESISIKLLSIGFLVLILLIPSSWIQSIIEERQQRMTEVITEVSEKWAYAQLLRGPVLVLPYKKVYSVFKDGKQELIESDEKAYFLPDDLKIKSELFPQTLHRGIFDVVVFESTINMEGKFGKIDLEVLNIDSSEVIWKDAYLVTGISDLRGIMNDPIITVNGILLKTEPGNSEPIMKGNSIKSRMKISEMPNDEFGFSINLKLKGSENLTLLPTGKLSDLEMFGNWGNPSFIGAFLPTTRKVGDSTFSAQWRILHYNRSFPQQWIGNQILEDTNAVGVKLLMPVDQYQKSIRTAKYSILIILLTFISLLMVEIIKKVRIHPFQYILIGSALIIYYTLLLSISEHVGFNIAYVFSSLLTVLLISFYSQTFMQNRNWAITVGAFLLSFYTFIYIITLQQDYALLMGSVGLFIIIGLIMYLSRKINWYKD